MSDISQILEIGQVMERLGLRAAEVYREIQAGRLKSASEEGRQVFRQEDLDAFIASRDTAIDEFAAEVRAWLQRCCPPADADHADPMAEACEQDERARLTTLGEWLVRDAVTHSVRDLYLDPTDDGFRVLSRRAATTEEVGRLSVRLGQALRDQFKGKIGQTETVTNPESGLFVATVDDQKHQVCITVAPTLMGEHVHLGFQDMAAALDFESMGYTSAQGMAMESMLNGGAGILFVVGPADAFAGRQRRALAMMLASGNQLVISLEHRVQFRSELLVQLDITTGEDGNFAALWETSLAMSPDTIFLDDIQTSEEVTSLLEGAAAGITVIAQVRAPGTITALGKLLDLKIDAGALGRNLLGVVSRRAYRRLCPECRKAKILSAEEAQAFGFDTGVTVYVAGSCDTCHGGYVGERMVFDVRAHSPELADLIKAASADREVLQSLPRDLPTSLTLALREAVVAGDIAIDDAARRLC